MQFDWPWIFLLLPLPLLVRWARQPVSTISIRIPAQLAAALESVDDATNILWTGRKLLVWLAWLSLLIAIAQPWQPGDTVVQPVSGRAIALAVDVSGSMERQDFTLNGQTSDRLSVVKRIANDFIAQRQGDRLSLVLYGKEAFIASPLTFDLAAVGSILDSAGIGMAGRSTAIGDALGLSIKTLQSDPATDKAIVLLSDGTNNAGSVEPESAAELAISLGIRIHTIAMGSEDTERSGYSVAQSADLDEDTLKSVADTANGEFFRATTIEDLRAVYSAIDTLERAEVAAPPVILRQDLRFWPQCVLLLSLLLLTGLQGVRT